jgi:malate dehydrogenase (oxaloacetate-decarboxylating)(NADP+)
VGRHQIETRPARAVEQRHPAPDSSQVDEGPGADRPGQDKVQRDLPRRRGQQHARDAVGRACGIYVLMFKRELLFLADTTVNIDPTAEQLAEIAQLTARVARRFEVEPRVALLSFSNFGSVDHPHSRKCAQAVQLLHGLEPSLMVDGEMQAQAALDPAFRAEAFPFSNLVGRANVLVFPDLQSGNLAYQLLTELGGAEPVGPILAGMRRPVHVLQTGFDVDDIVTMTAIAVLDAQDA